MKPPINHPKKSKAASRRADLDADLLLRLRQPRSVASRLLCVGLLALMLVWRSPVYVTAQTADKDQQKANGGTTATNSAASKPEADASDKPGQTSPASESKSTTAAEKDPPSSDKEKKEKKKEGETKGADDKSSDEIQVSFQGANIDMVAQWLAQTSGKSVLKHPRVQCQLTIIGGKKHTKREALNLVYRALALEGFTSIESSKAILIVPEGQEPKMSPELIGASRNDIPEG